MIYNLAYNCKNREQSSEKILFKFVISNKKQSAKKPQQLLPKILIVEDEPIQQHFIVSAFEELGYTNLDVVSNGKDAIEFFKNNDYSLILSDICLPDVNGIEICKKIREENKKQRNYTIFVAISSNKNYQLECFTADMNGFIPKPFSIKHVAALLKNWLGDSLPEEILKKINRTLKL